MENTRRSRRLRHETPELGLLHPLESPGTQWVSLLDPAIADLTDAMKALNCRKDSSAASSHEVRVAPVSVAGLSEDYLPLQLPIMHRGKFSRSPNSRATLPPRHTNADADMTAFVDAIHALDAVHGAHAADDSVLLADNPAAETDAALDDELAMIMLDAQRLAADDAFLDAMHELDAAFEEPDAYALLPENQEAEAAALLDQELVEELLARQRAQDDERDAACASRAWLSKRAMTQSPSWNVNAL